MAKLTAKQRSRAKTNAAKRGKRRGAYDNLKAAGKPMKATTKRKSKSKRKNTRRKTK